MWAKCDRERAERGAFVNGQKSVSVQWSVACVGVIGRILYCLCESFRGEAIVHAVAF